LEEYLVDLTSGSVKLVYAAAEDNETAQEQFENGDVLGLITIPSNLSERLDAGEVVEISISINNINDDVTKNFLQRMQNALNYFNDGLTVGDTVYNIRTLLI
jgi:ABC-type Na+ efflux pump permease subunit